MLSEEDFSEQDFSEQKHLLLCLHKLQDPNDILQYISYHLSHIPSMFISSIHRLVLQNFE